MSTQDRSNPLAPLEPWLNDPQVGEIMVDGHDNVYVERDGKLVDVPTPFRDDEHLLEAIAALLAPTGQRLMCHPLWLMRPCSIIEAASTSLCRLFHWSGRR